MNNLLLDTCAFIWLSQGGGELSKSAIEQIDNANMVYVSSISAWEISLLTSRKQLELPSAPRKWFQEFIVEQDIKLIDLNSEIAFISNELPWHHKDPADRFIIATAINHKLTIVTKDKCIPNYAISTIS